MKTTPAPDALAALMPALDGPALALVTLAAALAAAWAVATLAARYL